MVINVWANPDCPTTPGIADEWYATTATRSPHAFALVVHGDSMEPKFLEGEVIVVDPDKQRESGSYVIAKNGDEATFKRLLRDGSSVFLVPLNERYKPKDMTGISFKIVGVVVQKITDIS